MPIHKLDMQFPDTANIGACLERLRAASPVPFTVERQGRCVAVLVFQNGGDCEVFMSNKSLLAIHRDYCDDPRPRRIEVPPLPDRPNA